MTKRPDVAARNVENTTNLTNRKFGRLKVLEQTGSDKHGAIWLCKCKCGEKKEIPAANLLASKRPTRSCGCLQREKATKHMQKLGEKPNRFKDLSGQDYFSWKIEKFLRFLPEGKGAVYLCRCSCGNEKEINGRYLREKRAAHDCGCGASQ